MHASAGDPLLTSVFARRGPFVTVYLDLTRPPGSGAEIVDEQWAAVREELSSAGADDDTLDAVEEVLPLDIAAGRAFGLVVVAAGGEVCLRERFHPPTRSSATYAPLPRLLPYLAGRVPYVGHLVVWASAGRCRILRVEHGDLTVLWPTDGADRLDASGVARAATRFVSRFDPELVLVSGDAASAVPIVDELSRLLVADVPVRVIGSVEADADALLHVVGDALREHARASRSEVLGQVRGASGPRRRVVTGARDVSSVLRMAQVDTMVLADGAAMRQRCWIGARPTEFGMKDADAGDVGVELVRRDVIGSALVRAAVATGVTLLLTGPDEDPPPQDVAALLR